MGRKHGGLEISLPAPFLGGGSLISAPLRLGVTCNLPSSPRSLETSRFTSFVSHVQSERTELQRTHPRGISIAGNSYVHMMQSNLFGPKDEQF